MSLWTLFLDTCGVVGNIAFGVGCVPTAYNVVRAGKNELLPVNFAWILWTAVASFYTYLLGSYGWNWLTGPLGLVEGGAYTTVLWYTYLPRPANWLDTSSTAYEPSEMLKFLGPDPTDNLPFDMNAEHPLAWSRKPGPDVV